MDDATLLTPQELNALLPGIAKLNRDLVKAIKDKVLVMNRRDIRYLVDLYYQLQRLRIGAANQARTQDQEPTELLEWILIQAKIFEANIQRALNAWTKTHSPSSWARSIRGIGPVLAAGLAAHIDMQIATNVSKIWRFAGLDPTIVWKKGQKRPYNARLKVLCWKVADSFVKVSGNPKSFYGQQYRKWKELEIAHNEAGKHKDLCKKELKTRKNLTENQKKYYQNGLLPPGRIDLRARRRTVKLFLSHYFEVAYQHEYHVPPHEPYPSALLGHSTTVSAINVTQFEREGGKGEVFI